ncbi:MAG: ABC transporter ATP-binding protein [Chitinophagales bacterium]
MQASPSTSEQTTFRKILSLTDGHKPAFYTAMGLSLLLAIIGPIRPKLVEYAVDKNIAGKDFTALKWTVMGIFALLVLETLVRYAFSFLASWLGSSIIKDLRIRVYSHIIQAKLSYFDTTPIGTSTTRTITDVEAINDTFSEGLITILADILVILLVLFFMFAGKFSMHPTQYGFAVPVCDFSTWKVALVSLTTLPVLLIVTRWFQQGVKVSFQEERTQIAKLNAFLQEHISGMRIVQIFNVQKREFEKFDSINTALRDANVKGIWYYSLFFPAVEICMATAIGITVAVAAKYILNKELEIGIIMSFILYINMLFRPLRFIADKVNTIQRGMIAAGRVFQLLDTPLAIDDKGKVEKNMQGNIAFSNVYFAYNDDDYVLKDLSFSIEQGQTLAIVGSTGSGKTSTISVLNRMYEINKGIITIDGINIHDYTLASLRSQMSIVLQDVFLFSGTVFENITMRNPTISKTEVEAAARAIGAHEFIMQLPGSYDYKVMERGLALSLGQRQLISFVRALVFNPKILILDEATSSIDSYTEAIVQKAIEKMIKGRTSVVIAHRLSTIRNATKILVMEHGERKEFGSHEELLAMNGRYAKLYYNQFQQGAATID